MVEGRAVDPSDEALTAAARMGSSSRKVLGGRVPMRPPRAGERGDGLAPLPPVRVADERTMVTSSAHNAACFEWTHGLLGA